MPCLMRPHPPEALQGFLPFDGVEIIAHQFVDLSLVQFLHSSEAELLLLLIPFLLFEKVAAVQALEVDYDRNMVTIIGIAIESVDCVLYALVEQLGSVGQLSAHGYFTDELNFFDFVNDVTDGVGIEAEETFVIFEDLLVLLVFRLIS